VAGRGFADTCAEGERSVGCLLGLLKVARNVEAHAAKELDVPTKDRFARLCREVLGDGDRAIDAGEITALEGTETLDGMATFSVRQLIATAYEPGESRRMRYSPCVSVTAVTIAPVVAAPAVPRRTACTMIPGTRAPSSSMTVPAIDPHGHL
jgi:hypothetical protein